MYASPIFPKKPTFTSLFSKMFNGNYLLTTNGFLIYWEGIPPEVWENFCIYCSSKICSTSPPAPPTWFLPIPPWSPSSLANKRNVMDLGFNPQEGTLDGDVLVY